MESPYSQVERLVKFLREDMGETFQESHEAVSIAIRLLQELKELRS